MLEENNKETVLIIPDIHGRDFWKIGVEKRKPGEKIIFLGDYTDPYPHENISHDVIPEMLEEIINVPNSIFLLGNHDLSYIYPSQSPSVRKDWDLNRVKRIEDFFKRNHDKFQITYMIERSNKSNVIFSHAGLLKDLYQYRRGEKKKYKMSEVATKFNDWWKNREDSILTSEFFKISWYRGGYDDVGSLVWADIREHVARKHYFWSPDYQVFGHTMLKTGKIIQFPLFACVDCQRPIRMKWNQKNPEFTVL